MSVALYRRYRPESFDELIGQTQVTDPLRAALRRDRVNHAYLFSGPRGCGKTTSARILARCLNCAEGPTDTPCGKCPSCIELSREGGGSLDVVEIDAASHNGVDDARELRERAAFAPARDRYKIFILDEAHMVTQQGFNALLKLVEEPPDHVKFIFATTEPEKVISTIRSRTHHYPFRLVPPATMLDYVAGLCESEKVSIEDGVLPLVIRAGGGSVRDTLSLLDQIIAGSESETVTKERTNNLLGFTPSELLDEVIESVGRGDSASAFAAVDRVVQTGNDPRRFVEDVLERFRDLVIAEATGDGADAVLRGLATDEIERIKKLADAYGASRLSLAADIVNAALNGMTGTTPPRIHLELMIARLLMELGSESKQPESKPAASATQVSEKLTTAPSSAAPAVITSTPTPDAETSQPVTQPLTAAAKSAQVEPISAVKPKLAEPVVEAETGSTSLAELVQIWPEILEELKSNAAVWVVVNAARPAEINGDVLTLEFGDQLFVDRFKEKPASGKAVFEELREAIIGAVGMRFRFIPRTGPGLRTVPNQQSAPAELKKEKPSETLSAPVVEPAKEPTLSPVSEPAVSEADGDPESTKKMPKLDEEAVGDVVIQGILGGKIVKTIPNTDAAKTADKESEMDAPMFNFDAKESE